jgi:hypothetical protein
LKILERVVRGNCRNIERMIMKKVKPDGKIQGRHLHSVCANARPIAITARKPNEREGQKAKFRGTFFMIRINITVNKKNGINT